MMHMSPTEQEMVSHSSLMFLHCGEQMIHTLFVSLSTADFYDICRKWEDFQLKFMVICYFRNKLGSCNEVSKGVFSKLKNSSALDTIEPVDSKCSTTACVCSFAACLGRKIETRMFAYLELGLSYLF